MSTSRSCGFCRWRISGVIGAAARLAKSRLRDNSRELGSPALNRPKANLCVVEDMPVSSFRRILLHVLRCQILLSCRTTDSRFQNGGGCMKRWLLVTLAVLCFGVYAFSQT